MSARTAIVTEIGSLRAERIPALVSEKIMRFLNAGHTGQVTLHIKDGRILGWELKECGRLNDHEIDRVNGSHQD